MKKFVCFFLATAFLLTSITCAFAAGSMTPSSTSHAAGRGTSTSGNGSNRHAPAVEVVVTDASDAVNDQIAAMNAAVAAGQSPLSTLPSEIQAQMAELGNDVTVNEACAISVKNFKEGRGDIDTVFTFARHFESGMKVLTLVTCFGANKEVKEQFVLPATISPEGKVIVHFTENVLKAIDEADSSSTCIFEKK